MSPRLYVWLGLMGALAELETEMILVGDIHSDACDRVYLGHSRHLDCYAVDRDEDAAWVPTVRARALRKRVSEDADHVSGKAHEVQP